MNRNRKQDLLTAIGTAVAVFADMMRNADAELLDARATQNKIMSEIEELEVDQLTDLAKQIAYEGLEVAKVAL